jgi:hypothetical protein
LRIRADEHVYPEIVEAVSRICLSDNWRFDHVYDSGDKGKSDEHWITSFANSGGHAIITADADFTRKPPQVVAVFKTGVKVLHLPSKWGAAPGHLQTAHILCWWPRIETQLTNMKQRECFQPEWNISGVAGSFKKVDIDFAKAHQKLRKAAA